MNQPLIEVKERKMSLVLGLFCTIIFGVLMVVNIMDKENMADNIHNIWLFGLLMLIGIYLLLAYINHRLKVFIGGTIEYSNSIGKKKTFHYRDIANIEQGYVKTTKNLTLRDAKGKRLVKVEGNMIGFEEFVQWLDKQQKTAADAREDMAKFGITGTEPAAVEPVKVQGTGIGSRIFLGIMGVILLVAGFSVLNTGITQTREDAEAEEPHQFDPYSWYEEKQMVEFEMISDPFAFFEYSDKQGLYFVFDADMRASIICMDVNRLESEFSEIYEYTFSDSVQVPKAGVVEGYAIPIEEDLKTIAIEEFNYLWNEEVLTEENFEDYLGVYYLDTTYQPDTEGENPLSMILTGALFLVIGICVFYYITRGYKKAKQKAQKQNSFTDKKQDGFTDEGQTGFTNQEEEKVTLQNTVDLPIPRNILATLLAVLIGAALGGVCWIICFKLGRIAAISGCLAVMGAIWGWSKFGRRELTTGAWIFCVLIGVGMIFFANYVSYAWDIMDVINQSSPGRAQFTKILTNMPSLMKEMELWGSFAADLAMGLLFAALAGFGGRPGKKDEKNQ